MTGRTGSIVFSSLTSLALLITSAGGALAKGEITAEQREFLIATAIKKCAFMQEVARNPHLALVDYYGLTSSDLFPIKREWNYLRQQVEKYLKPKGEEHFDRWIQFLGRVESQHAVNKIASGLYRGNCKTIDMNDREMQEGISMLYRTSAEPSYGDSWHKRWCSSNYIDSFGKAHIRRCSHYLDLSEDEWFRRFCTPSKRLGYGEDHKNECLEMKRARLEKACAGDWSNLDGETMAKCRELQDIEIFRRSYMRLQPSVFRKR